jgi:hypothetical protein
MEDVFVVLSLVVLAELVGHYNGTIGLVSLASFQVVVV